MTRLACAALLTCLMLPAAAPAQLAEVICDDRARLEQRLATVQGAAVPLPRKSLRRLRRNRGFSRGLRTPQLDPAVECKRACRKV